MGCEGEKTIERKVETEELKAEGRERKEGRKMDDGWMYKLQFMKDTNRERDRVKNGGCINGWRKEIGKRR